MCSHWTVFSCRRIVKFCCVLWSYVLSELRRWWHARDRPRVCRNLTTNPLWLTRESNCSNCILFRVCSVLSFETPSSPSRLHTPQPSPIEKVFLFCFYQSFANCVCNSSSSYTLGRTKSFPSYHCDHSARRARFYVSNLFTSLRTSDPHSEFYTLRIGCL